MKPEMLKCKVCNKLFIKPTLGRPKIYCSDKCNSISQCSKHKRMAPSNKTCAECGGLFLPKSNNKRFRFCCRQCKQKWRNKRPIHTKRCIYCNKIFKTNNLKHKFCSLNCSVSGTKINKYLICKDCGKSFTFIGRTTKHRCDKCHEKYWHKWYCQYPTIKRGGKVGVGSGGNQWGEKNHSWKPANEHKGNYIANYKLRCYSLWNKQCIVCDKLKGIQIHHIDGDPTNYKEDNLIPLCWIHHIKAIHYKRWKTKEEYIEAFYKMLEEVAQSKIAEKTGNAEKPIRGEGIDQKQYQPQRLESDPIM